MGQEVGVSLDGITQNIAAPMDMISEKDLREIELKLGNGASRDLLTFESRYTSEMGKEPDLPVTRAFQQFRSKVNARQDRNIDFINTNENKSLGLSGPESKPTDVVDVELPANTKPKSVSRKIKKSGRPESN